MRHEIVRQIRDQMLSWHFVVQFLVGAIPGRMMLDRLEAAYEDAPWWIAAVIYMAMGFLVSGVYDDVLEIRERMGGKK